MEENQNLEEFQEPYKIDGSVIAVEWEEAVYDCFVFNGKKIVVLKNEEFDEFISTPTDSEIQNMQKHFMLGKIFTEDGTDRIVALSKEDYAKALDYYILLKKAFLGVSNGKK